MSCRYIGLKGYNTALNDFAWRRGIFQNICPDGDAFVRSGIGYVRSLVH